MAFPATAILVLIASPGDTAEERAAIQLQLNKWNVTRGEREGIVLVPWLYEQHAVPMMGDHPQSVINGQAVDRADVVVAFFDSKLGTETPAAVSGTAEEITRANDAGKPVHVYFSNEDIPRSADPKQLVKLEKFKKDLQAKGLLGEYNSPDQLANQVTSAIDYDVSTQEWSTTTPRQASGGADLVARHDYERIPSGTSSNGKPRYRTTTNHLVISNKGDRTAMGVRVSMEPGEFMFEGPEEPFDLPKDSEVQYSLIGIRSCNAQVNLRWEEDGQPKEAHPTITVKGSV